MADQWQWDFTALSRLPPELQWLHPPASSELAPGEGLIVHPTAKTDFWKKTYYEPPIDAANGHALLCSPPATDRWNTELSFSLKPRSQFDQAGIFVWESPGLWLKAGIEWVDSRPRLSCVFTAGKSDWSVQPWSGGGGAGAGGEGLRRVCVRVSRVRDSLVVEAKADGKWELVRIAPLPPTSSPSSLPLKVGPYCCAPTEAGFAATFLSLAVSKETTFDHHA